MNRKIDIFKPLFLTELYNNVISGKPTKEIRRLTTDEMHKIPEIYAQVPYTPDDLHEGQSILDVIESEKEYTTGNGKTILGDDIKAITTLMYLSPRTAYWKPDRPQVHDTSASGAVPLPMLGFKRWKGIDYQEWNYFSTVGGGSEPLAEGVYNQEDEMPYFEINTSMYEPGDVVEHAFCVDLLLGKTLASTYYDVATDEVSFNKLWGLFILSAFNTKDYRPGFHDIQTFRNYGKGKHPGSYATAYGTAKVPDEHFNEYPTIMHLYNQCNTPMRLMLAQRWAWYGKHRNDDMICDFQNWNNMPKSVDHISQSLHSIKPDEAFQVRFNLGDAKTKMETGA